jgi:hypothetical protein
LFVNITELNIEVCRSSLSKLQKERMVYEAAKDPVGLSVSRLSVVTDMDVDEVKRIVLQLHGEGLLKEKTRGHFMGWVSVDNRRSCTRFPEL